MMITPQMTANNNTAPWLSGLQAGVGFHADPVQMRVGYLPLMAALTTAPLKGAAQGGKDKEAGTWRSGFMLFAFHTPRHQVHTSYPLSFLLRVELSPDDVRPRA